MTSDNRARLRVAALIFVMVNAVVFGVGLLTVLMTPALSQHAFLWIPIVIVSSFVFSPPLAWLIAPMMMQRFIQARRLAGAQAAVHCDARHIVCYSKRAGDDRPFLFTSFFANVLRRGLGYFSDENQVSTSLRA